MEVQIVLPSFLRPSTMTSLTRPRRRTSSMSPSRASGAAYSEAAGRPIILVADSYPNMATVELLTKTSLPSKSARR